MSSAFYFRWGGGLQTLQAQYSLPGRDRPKKDLPGQHSHPGVPTAYILYLLIPTLVFRNRRLDLANRVGDELVYRGVRLSDVR
jgi:hypothetical protein